MTEKGKTASTSSQSKTVHQTPKTRTRTSSEGNRGSNTSAKKQESRSYTTSKQQISSSTTERRTGVKKTTKRTPVRSSAPSRTSTRPKHAKTTEHRSRRSSSSPRKEEYKIENSLIYFILSVVILALIYLELVSLPNEYIALKNQSLRSTEYPPTNHFLLIVTGKMNRCLIFMMSICS